jgi:predicted flap endonuclease-1-like 5' DNA nuclease
MTVYKIQEIEGIGEVLGAKLEAVGIATTSALLKTCADPKGRAALSEKTGIAAERLLKWTNLADLMRIRGIGKQYSELLEASGVDTVKELKTRRADNLATKVAEVNEEKKLTRAVPTEKMIAGWVAQAKALPPAITY